MLNCNESNHPVKQQTIQDENKSASLQRGSFPRMEEVSSAATGSTVVDLSGDSHLQVRGCWVGGNNGFGLVWFGLVYYA